MQMILRWADRVVFQGYAWFLILAGGIPGLFFPKWLPFEFEIFARTVFNAPFMAQDMASALNQYRFMKSSEFGFGLFALLFCKEIYSNTKFNAYFLGILFLGAFIRAYSIVVDGQPHMAYVIFTGLEMGTGLIILIRSKQTIKQARGLNE